MIAHFSVLIPSYEISPNEIVSDNNTDSLQLSVRTFSFTQFRNEFTDLKPILRHLMQSMMIVMITNNAVCFSFSLFIGGQTIEDITKTPLIDQIHKKLSSIKIFVSGFLIIAVSYTLSWVIFNISKIKSVFNNTVYGIPYQEMGLFNRLSAVTAANFIQHIFMTKIPVLFLYLMLVYQQILKQMKNQITGNLNFEQLNTLKVKLEKLSRHLQKVMRSFALPMTVNFIADTIFLIACSCFLLISDDHRKAHYYCSIIFTHLIYCLLRISVYCLAGSLVVNQFDQLVVTTFEHVNNWSSRQLMLFQKISQLKFTVTIWGVYSVQQSTMLSILAFALSYVIVLLQTESYTMKS